MLRSGKTFHDAVMFALMLLLVLAGAALAQAPGGWIPADAQVFEKEGTVVDIELPNGIQMLTERDAAWVIMVDPRQSTVSITGTAEPDFLRTGLFIKFTGEIDKKGVLQGEIKDMKIFTPTGKNSTGMFNSGAGDDAKPITKLEAGTYDFRGKVASYKDGDIKVVAGKPITGKVASDCKIDVNVSDLSLAQKDDPMKVKGYYYEKFGPSPKEGRPGQAMGKEVTITLSKPLAGIKKPVATKPVRGPKGKQPVETTPVNPDDPFGLNKATKDEKK